MLAVRLLSNDLEFIADVELPPFHDHGMPEMVMWDQRCFLRHGKFSDGPWFYLEGFWLASPTPPTGLLRIEQGIEPRDTRPDLPHTMRKAGSE